MCPSQELSQKLEKECIKPKEHKSKIILKIRSQLCGKQIDNKK